MVYQNLGIWQRLKRLVMLAVLVLGVGSCTTVEPVRSDAACEEPPAAPREFRGLWVASVANIDWPSARGLSSAMQIEEIRRIVKRARELNLNALIVQVRPAADALYPSTLEPWSEYLTGTQGQPPNPYYDPLLVWIEEAHRAGIELHAWFNPYRARHTSAKSANAANHIANKRPDVVKSYGGFLWMDPAEAAAAQQTVDVILDVVRRYDIDGVHIDDYFYPYPVKASTAANAPEVDFPDQPAWANYLLQGGKLARADWRREQVNRLIERLYGEIHREKQWVRFGISPFGLGKPERRPPGINGFSQYDKLYADVELWLNKGWLDYLAPQLYWPVAPGPQAFEPLMDNWIRENTQGRHLWPGLYTSRIDSSDKSWVPGEILAQIALMRSRSSVSGHLHFSAVALLENRKSISDQLAAAAYAVPALTPATLWLDNVVPPAPGASMEALPSGQSLRLKAAPGETPAQFAVWTRWGEAWVFTRVPAAEDSLNLPARRNGNPLAAVVVSAVDRVGNESARVCVKPLPAS